MLQFVIFLLLLVGIFYSFNGKNCLYEFSVICAWVCVCVQELSVAYTNRNTIIINFFLLLRFEKENFFICWFVGFGSWETKQWKRYWHRISLCCINTIIIFSSFFSVGLKPGKNKNAMIGLMKWKQLTNTSIEIKIYFVMANLKRRNMQSY